MPMSSKGKYLKAFNNQPEILNPLLHISTNTFKKNGNIVGSKNQTIF